MLIAVSTGLLLGYLTPTQPYERIVVAPDDEVGRRIRVESEVTGGMRHFRVLFPDPLLPTGPPSVVYRVAQRVPPEPNFWKDKRLEHADVERVGESWIVNLAEPTHVAWSAILLVLEPSRRQDQGPDLVSYDLPLMPFINLDEEEAKAYDASKREVMAYDLTFRDRHIRRGDLLKLGAVFTLGDEEGNQTRVIFLDGTEALIPVVPPD